jgi:glutamine amidotransferase
MCRWLVYASASGDAPMRLADVLSRPAHSLIRQAYHAGAHAGFSARNNAVMNADGFGLCWFSLDGRRAFLFKSSQPAWSDKNLRDLCEAVESYVIFGHVRAASLGSIVGFENTHPFRHGRLAFQHNGHIEGFCALRRRFSSLLSDEAFASVKGLTDSEHAFALLLTHLRDCGRTEPFAPAELAEAMERTIAVILELLAQAGVTGGFTSANFAVTDGETVVVTRFCDKHPAIPPPSLYFAFPTAAELHRELGGERNALSVEPGDGSGNCAGAEVVGASAAASSAAAAASGPEPGLDGEEGDAHGVDSARWTRDEAFLAAARPSARERVLLVASEPATAGPHVAWLTLPANAMLVYHRGGGGVPVLSHLAPEALPKTGVTDGAGATR